MSKHTPGPWRTYGGPAHPQRHHLAVIDSIPDQDGRVVANCICHVAGTNQDADANARLIAAAPELLAACKYAIEAIASLQDDSDGSVISPARSQLRRAIEKATEVVA